MNTLELVLWSFITLACIKLDNKPIYEHFQDLKIKFNKFIGKEESIEKYIEIEN
jgi:hypothetical protein